MSRMLPTLATVLTLAVFPVHAEEQASDPGLDAMRAISFLVGEWTGDGWMQRGPDRSTFTSSESVESRLDGRVLIVEGLHHAEGDQVVHHALATISYDTESATYRFRSHLSDGKSGEYEGRLVDGAFVWTIPTGQGEVRYTIHVDGDGWHEVGHFSRDGESWSQFFQMDLEREGT